MQEDLLYTVNENEAWLAVYLYCAEPWEKISVEAIKPFAEMMLDRGLVTQYFYIRYWERGPHLRLRFKGTPQALLEQVKPEMDTYFRNYLQAHPSERQEPQWLEKVEEDYQWYPNDSLQYITYEPEIDRYGGEPEPIGIAERQFQASSNAILDIMSESEDWDYNRALGAAIQMHLGFAYGLDMDLVEASAFYARFFENWLPRAYYHYGEEVSKEELLSRKKETLKVFGENFNAQKSNLLPFFETVWEALRSDEEFEQEWLNEWVRQMRNIGTALKKVQQEGKLNVPEWYMSKEHAGWDRDQVERWAIYDSYIHMTNNRLGIQNRDEGYLGYLVKESFNALTVGPNS